MAHSMESRLPFLDQELVEWILRLPASAIVSGGWSRRILREAMRGILPEEVRTRRRKIGFTTPEFRWFRQQRSSLQSLMRSPSFQSRPYWDAEAIAAAFRVACAGGSEESLFFWRAVNVELWLRVYFEGDLPRDRRPGRRRLRSPGRPAGGGGGGAAALVAAAQANPGRHLIVRGTARPGPASRSGPGWCATATTWARRSGRPWTPRMPGASGSSPGTWSPSARRWWRSPRDAPTPWTRSRCRRSHGCSRASSGGSPSASAWGVPRPCSWPWRRRGRPGSSSPPAARR